MCVRGVGGIPHNNPPTQHSRAIDQQHGCGGAGCPLRPRRHAMHARTVAVARRRVRVLTALRRLSACAGAFPTSRTTGTGQRSPSRNRNANLHNYARTWARPAPADACPPHCLSVSPPVHLPVSLSLSLSLSLFFSLSLSLSKHTPHTARNTQTVFRAPEHATRLGGQRGGAPNVARGVSARKPAGCAAFNLRRRRPLCLAPIAPASNPCETETNSTKLSTEVQSTD